MSAVARFGRSILAGGWLPLPEAEDTAADKNFRLIVGGLSVAFLFGALPIIFCAAPLKTWFLLLSCLASGGAVGFLFGIPKVEQDAWKPRAAQEGEGSYQQLVNTNLEQISDWLTKMIVGLGLVELRNVPTYLDRISTHLATAVGDVSQNIAPVLATVIVYFAVLGFLGGYLLTRLFLAAAFRIADLRASLREGIFARVEAMESRQQAILHAVVEKREKAQGSEPIDDALRQMAIEYNKANEISDQATKVARKTQIAREMGLFVVTKGISRDQLATSSDPALQVALANAVIIAAESADVDRLLALGPNVRRWHVQYAMVLAFQQLLKAGFVESERKKELERIMDRYYEGGDGPLKALVDSTRAFFRTS